MSSFSIEHYPGDQHYGSSTDYIFKSSKGRGLTLYIAPTMIELSELVLTKDEGWIENFLEIKEDLKDGDILRVTNRWLNMVQEELSK